MQITDIYLIFVSFSFITRKLFSEDICRLIEMHNLTCIHNDCRNNISLDRSHKNFSSLLTKIIKNLLPNTTTKAGCMLSNITSRTEVVKTVTEMNIYIKPLKRRSKTNCGWEMSNPCRQVHCLLIYFLY